ncbi:MAG: hypothetical protein GY811_25195 [Myxococcales bacterium]|nr:hypothetical protein [Myxococcales bacterium]
MASRCRFAGWFERTRTLSDLGDAVDCDPEIGLEAGATAAVEIAPLMILASYVVVKAPSGEPNIVLGTCCMGVLSVGKRGATRAFSL